MNTTAAVRSRFARARYRSPVTAIRAPGLGVALSLLKRESVKDRFNSPGYGVNFALTLAHHDFQNCTFTVSSVDPGDCAPGECLSVSAVR